MATRKTTATQVAFSLDEGATLPTRAHADDAGYDLYLSERTAVRPNGALTMAHTGTHVAIPKGHVGLVFVRSSVGRDGITLANGTGIIDGGYTGEILLPLTSRHTVTKVFERGTRLAQLVIVPCVMGTPVEVESLGRTDRGQAGFGSTGTK